MMLFLEVRFIWVHVDGFRTKVVGGNDYAVFVLDGYH
jgi:hypothetical protein